jgi:hypothetical protein
MFGAVWSEILDELLVESRQPRSAFLVILKSPPAYLGTPMTATQDSLRSSYREMLMEHLLVSEIMKFLWLRGVSDFEVLKPEVDDSGYDLVLEIRGMVRHVQLKSSFDDAKTASVNVSIKLG